ncbi:hypothetical protein IG631_01014 [Alternaria alternata]|nr:hypothetical protein IG631_01014 [Alternaria alternata]
MSSYRDLTPRPQDVPAVAPGNSRAGSVNRTPSRVAAACITCRARRTKCDSERPACRSCVEREITCGYDPPTGTLLAQAQKRKIEELETDRSSLYEVLWYLQTASPSKATALLRHMRAAQGEDLGVIFRNFEMNRPSSSMSAAAPETDASKGYASSVINDSSSSVMLSMPEVMDHPNFSVAQKKQFNMMAITLLAPNQQDAFVDKINGPLDMFFGCVGALFYIMNKDDVQISIAAMKASGNGHIPLGDVLTNGSNIQLRTYAAELAGMAAIGVVHSQLADPETAPPPELADYFYAVAKHGLDSAISFSPLRAMKICSLLGMYNIVVKATVALAYIGMILHLNISIRSVTTYQFPELGLSLPRNQKISLKTCPPGWSLGYYEDIRRTYRTLVHLQCWLSASLDHDSDPVIQDITSPQDELDVPPEDMIRRECVKVSIIKASLLRHLPTKAPVLEGTILEYRVRLSRFHARLPNWMSIASLLGGENTELMATFRPVIYYVHLFYLSAMMLLSRRLIIAYIPLDAIGSVTLPSEAQRAIEEGYQAAETNASVMDLMLQEGKVVQVCWLCIYTSYTAGIMIAHKASQNALHNEPFAHGMVLLSKCIGVLGYCAIKDVLAGKFHDILTEHMSMLRQYESTLARSGNSATPSSSSSNDSLFIFQRGSSNLHIAVLNLLRTIHHPFGGLRDVTAQNTLSNRAETTMGTHLEWEYELESRDLAQARPKDSKLADTVDAKIESMTPLCSSSEQDAPMQKLLAQPQGEAWTKWTPATWQNSFHMPQNSKTALGIGAQSDVLVIQAKVQKEYAKADNTSATFQTLDVQDEASITSAFTTIRTTLRHPIRGLVSCAAISGESDACDYPITTFRKILDINISGTFLIARAVANELHSTNLPGSIVLFASISGHISNHGINTAAYNASKAAVHQLARSLAAEWGHPQNTFPGSTVTETNPNPSQEPRKIYPPIRVNTISPGHIDTPLSAEARKRGLTEEWAKQNMLGRISVPEEFRAPVLFLLSEGSSYVTGSVS